MGSVFDTVQHSVSSGALESASEQVARRAEDEKFSLNDPVALPRFTYAPLSANMSVADLDPDPQSSAQHTRLEVTTEPPPYFLSFGPGEHDKLCIFHQADAGKGWVDSVAFDKEVQGGPPPTLGFTVTSRKADGTLHHEKGTFEINEEGEPINATFRGETKTLEDMRREYLVARERRYSLDPDTRKQKAEQFQQSSTEFDTQITQKRDGGSYTFSQRTSQRKDTTLANGMKRTQADTPLFVTSIGVLSSSENIGFLSNDGDWEASPLSDHQKEYKPIPHNPDKHAWQNPAPGAGALDRVLAALPKNVPVQDRNEVYRPVSSEHEGNVSYTFAHQYNGWRDYRDLNSGLGVLNLPESALPAEVATAYHHAAEQGGGHLAVGQWIEKDDMRFAVQWDGKIVFSRGDRQYDVWNPLESMRAARNATAAGTPVTLRSSYDQSLSHVQGAEYDPASDSMTLDLQSGSVESPVLAEIPDQSTTERTYDRWATVTEKLPEPVRPEEPTREEVVQTLAENRKAFRTELAAFTGVTPMPDMMNPGVGNRPLSPDSPFTLFNTGGRFPQLSLLSRNPGTNPLRSRHDHNGLPLFQRQSQQADPFAMMGIPVSHYAAGPFLRWMPTAQSSEDRNGDVRHPENDRQPSPNGQDAKGSSFIPLDVVHNSDAMFYLNPDSTYRYQQTQLDNNPFKLKVNLPGNARRNRPPLARMPLLPGNNRNGVALVFREQGGLNVVGQEEHTDVLRSRSDRDIEKAGDALFASITRAKQLVAEGMMTPDELRQHTSGTLIDPGTGTQLAWMYQEPTEAEDRGRIVVLSLKDMPEVLGPLLGATVQNKSFGQWQEILIPRTANLEATSSPLQTLGTNDSGFRFEIESSSRDSSDSRQQSSDLDSLSVPRLKIRGQKNDAFTQALGTLFPASIDSSAAGMLQPKDCILMRAMVAEDGRITVQAKDFDPRTDSIPGLGTNSLPGPQLSGNPLLNTLSEHRPSLGDLSAQSAPPQTWVYDALGETEVTIDGKSEHHRGGYSRDGIYPMAAVNLRPQIGTTLLKVQTEDSVSKPLDTSSPPN